MKTCAATTKAGQPCRNMAMVDRDYCRHHGKADVAVADRPTDVELQRRVDHVMSALLAGKKRREIIEIANEEWGVAPSTVSMYIARARDQYRDLALDSQRDIYEWSVASRMDLYGEARDANDHRAALQILQDIARLHGLYDRRADLPDIDLTSVSGILASMTALFRGVASGVVDRGTLNSSILLANIALKALAQQDRTEDANAYDAEQRQISADEAKTMSLAELQLLTDQLLE